VTEPKNVPMAVPTTGLSGAPSELRTGEFVLRPIAEADAGADLEAVIESRDDLVGWEQSGWPADDFSVEDNRADLRLLAADHVAGRRFTYTMTDLAGERALGCVYVVPPTARFLAAAAVESLSDLAWSDVDAAVYFWVRSGLVVSGLEERLVDALRRWFARDWSLDHVVFVTTQDFTRQVELLSSLGLHQVVLVREPGKPTPYVAFGS